MATDAFGCRFPAQTNCVSKIQLKQWKRRSNSYQKRPVAANDCHSSVTTPHTDATGFKDSVRKLSLSSSLHGSILIGPDVVLPVAEFASKSAVWLRVTGNCDVAAIITNAGATIFRVGFNNFQHLIKLNDVKFYPFCYESFKIDADVSGYNISANDKWEML